MIRSNLEQAARKSSQGGLVREGLWVEPEHIAFDYDVSLGKTAEELAANKDVQFVVPARNKGRGANTAVMRSRPKFEHWGCSFVIDVDDDLIEKAHIEKWLEAGGRRVGYGDWRPGSPKGGNYGRFKVLSIEKLE